MLMNFKKIECSVIVPTSLHCLSLFPPTLMTSVPSECTVRVNFFTTLVGRTQLEGKLGVLLVPKGGAMPPPVVDTDRVKE